MYARGTLADFLGDRIVYRNLEPADQSLPSLGDIWQQIGMATYRVPRKAKPDYAAVIVHLLCAAQAARGGGPLRDLLFIGDTAMNDGTAARNLAVHLPLRGFIGTDRVSEPAQITYDGILMVGNRWHHLQDWLGWVQREGVACDECTSVLVDIDKTFIGARGRNDRVIDAARVDAVRQMAQEVLGGGFEEDRFVAVYDELCKPRYHPFTTDNQDYLAYISLMVMGDVFPADEFWLELEGERLDGFSQFVSRCEAHTQRMGEGLMLVHREVTANMQRGDPTPFKSFRNLEYLATVARMDCLPDDASRSELLAGEILMTDEVGQALEWLLARGVLTFGISDKPDEASTPPAGLATAGDQPIHRVRMKVIGGV